MKRIVSLLLTIVLALGLCSCGQNAAASWQEQYDLGIRYLSEGNYQEAILAFTAAIEIDEKLPEAYIGRGDAYALSGDTEDNLSSAQADYEAAIALDETLPGGWLGLADVYIRRGDYDKAMEVLWEALEKTGNDQSVADKLVEMEGGSFADSIGNVRRMEFKDAGGTVLWWHDYDCNEAGQEIRATVFDATGNQIDQWEGYEYDDQGRTIRSAGYSLNTGEFTTISESVYQDGYLMEHRQFSMDGMPSGSQQYEYDGKGNRTRTIGYDSNGGMIYYWTHTYDRQGHQIRTDYYHADGVAYGHCERTYGEDGEQTGVYQYDSVGNLIGYTEY